MKELTTHIFLPSCISQVFIILRVRQVDKLNTFSTPSAITKATFISVDNTFFKCISYNYFIGRQETDRVQFISAQYHPFTAFQKLWISLHVHSNREYILPQKYFSPLSGNIELTNNVLSSVFHLALLSQWKHSVVSGNNKKQWFIPAKTINLNSQLYALFPHRTGHSSALFKPYKQFRYLCCFYYVELSHL